MQQKEYDVYDKASDMYWALYRAAYAAEQGKIKLSYWASYAAEQAEGIEDHADAARHERIKNALSVLFGESVAKPKPK